MRKEISELSFTELLGLGNQSVIEGSTPSPPAPLPQGGEGRKKEEID